MGARVGGAVPGTGRAAKAATGPGAGADEGGTARAVAAARALGARLRRRLARSPGPWLKPAVFATLLAPFAYLVYALLTGALGPDPIKELTHSTGELALRYLILGLALTPLRHLLRATWPVRLRRMVGLFAFFHAAVHVAIWGVLDQALDPRAMLDDVIERPYVLAGTVAFLILLPLAATSTKRIARRLGARWVSLHRWTYLAAAAAVVHFVWLAKGDIGEPYVYLAVLAALFVARFAQMLKGDGAGRPVRAKGVPRSDRPVPAAPAPVTTG